VGFRALRRPGAATRQGAWIERLYGIECQVIPDPETGTPLVVPRRTRDVTPIPH
jgi:hypothetical protein